MIRTENLTKKFNQVIAVEQLNLEIHPGEVFGFLGPNGAGKTTTVRLLTTLIAPTSGKAWINGLMIGKNDTKIRQCVGVLTETPGLYDNLSAEYNLSLYANLYQVKDHKGQVEKYLRMLGLWERRHDVAGTFSKGMKQKLAIARSLLHEPPLLFLDEPTSSLDPEAALLVRDFISELRKQGRTIFLCTHNLDEADRLCDRIGVFKTHLLVLDTPDRLRSQLFGRQIVFHLRQADAKIGQAIAALPFVHDLQVIGNKLLTTIENPELNNPHIIRVLLSLGADVQFVGERRHSLEDVYMQLIKSS
jgi:ABC-2 type transport system ATP-binding protein